MILSATVRSATITLILAPAVAVPDKLLSVDSTLLPAVPVTTGSVGLTSTVTSFSGDTLPWLSVAFSLTVYLPGWFVLIVLFPVLPFTDTTSTCVPLPLVRPGLSSLSLALTKSVRFKVEPASTTFLSPWKDGVKVGASSVTGVSCQPRGLL